MLYNIAEPDKAYDKCHHLLNHFKSNETSHFYQMYQSIFVFRFFGCCFSLLFNFNRPSCKQTVEKLIRHCSLWGLILACTMCLCHTKRTLVLYGLNTLVVYVTHISYIVSSSNWIMIGYRAVLNICIGMAFAICRTEPVTIRIMGA